MKTIFITGASGFIGRNVIEQFKGKYNILCPNHKELELTDQFMVDEFFKKNNIDVVLHMATLGGRRSKTEDVKDMVKTNLQMFFNITRNSKYYKKLIQCGTGGEYDRRFEVKNVKEEDLGKTIPIDDYSFSKYLISKYIEGSKDNIVDLRFFAIFGKYEDYELRFISNAILKNLLDKPIIINQNVYFDYVYINDLVKILTYFIENDSKYKFYNVGTGKPQDLLSLANKINKISEKKSEIILKQEGLNKEFSCDNKRLLDEIKDFKFTPLEESIRELYLYYKENIEKLDLTNLLAEKYTNDNFYKNLKK